MAQVTQTPQVIRPKGLGPGFWQVTTVLLLIDVLVALLILYAPLDWLVPAASLPAADSTLSIDGLFKFMGVFGFAISFDVTAYVLYFAIVFRRRRNEPVTTIGVPIHDAPQLEFWWTVLPSALLIVLIYLTIVVWRQIYYPTVTALTMEVVMHQFDFEFRYPGLSTSVYSPQPNNGVAGTCASPLGCDMHLPIGKPVKILLSSGDVIHQFWVPAFRLKGAGVPGIVQSISMTPEQAGTYDITCSEYCGLNHSLMQSKLIVEPAAQFDAWLDQEKAAAAKAGTGPNLAAGDAAAGKATFAQKCSACHALAPFDQKIVGPGLLKITDDPAHPDLVDGKPPTPPDIAQILENGFTGPIGTMPNRQANGLSDTDIANLVAYLASLK